MSLSRHKDVEMDARQIRKARIGNESFYGSLVITPIDEKMRES